MFSIHTDKNNIILSQEHNPLQITNDWFNPRYWRNNNAITGEKKGRASTYFFDFKEGTGVLRHYWRGGLIGKLLTDQYFFSGLKRTRTYQEFVLLTKLTQLGLPVSKPIAARVTVCGFIYRGDLITEAVKDAQSVLDILKKRALTSHEYQKIANTLADFHNQGVCHADLNINNILLDGDGKVVLIDFDRGSIRQPSHHISQNNMARLLRSFNKEQTRNTPFHWQKSDWNKLSSSYQDALNEDLK